MIVYKGFGHPITKPRAMRAVMQHNLAWFNHYIWGDPLPDFTSPAVPKKEGFKPQDDLNERGKWLLSEKEKQKATEVKAEWLKNYHGK